jgi:branched-chain amino acid transport system ATP-binding protein
MTSASTVAPSEPLLEARGLVAGYGEAAIVSGIDLHVHAGEIVALFGPNGAGKSTSLLTMAGALPALGGEVRWRGEALRGPLHRRARMGLGLVTEERSTVMSLTVKDNLLLGRGGVDAAVALFPELQGLLRRRAGLLSGGEQQMLLLARALAADPAALLVDELSLGLAPLVVERLLAQLTAVARDRRVGVVLVEQQARRAFRVADRWYLMRRGRIVAEGDSSSGLEALERAYLAGDAVADSA